LRRKTLAVYGMDRWNKRVDSLVKRMAAGNIDY